jgi:hypothetical protein
LVLGSILKISIPVRAIVTLLIHGVCTGQGPDQARWPGFRKRAGRGVSSTL